MSSWEGNTKILTGISQDMKKESKRQRMAISVRIIRNSVLDNFKISGRPDPWKLPQRLFGKKNYGEGHGGIKRVTFRAKYQKPTLIITGTLKQIRIKSNDQEGVVYTGSTAPYAATMHYGSRIKHIPARPFMIFQDEDIEKIMEVWKILK
jgi:phage gpG-like protein